MIKLLSLLALCVPLISSAHSVLINGVDIGGNSATATALQTPRTINGVPFDGTTNITVSSGGADANEDAYYAVAVTLMRPSKIKWKLGSFGTFTPSERIYIRIANIVRFGSDTSNYMGGLYSSNSPFDFTPFESGASIIAHNSAAVVSYVTETDVAAVVNAKRTWTKMMAYLARTATITHYQARASGSSPKSGSSPTTITPGTYGSIVLESVGQGYEADLVGTVSGTGYIVPSLATKNAMSADGVDNQWGYAWFGRVNLMMPIAATMDSNSFTWDIKVYTANSNYDALLNTRVAALPSWWNDDVP